MKAVLVLIFTITANSGDENFEMRFNKSSYQQCVSEAKQFHSIPNFVRHFVVVEARCEKVLGKNDKEYVLT